MEPIPETFSIPCMDIMANLVTIDKHPLYLYLVGWVDGAIEKERGNWGIKGKGYHVSFDLEAHWYPIFTFDNRWLAHAFLRTYTSKVTDYTYAPQN